METYDGASAASTAEEMSSSLLRVLRASRELARADPLVCEVRRNRLLHSEAPVADGRLPRPDCTATARSKGREEGRRLQTLKTLPLAELGLKRRAFPRGGAESRRRRSSSADASRALSDTLLSTPDGRPDPLPPGSAFAPAKVQEGVLGVIGVDLVTAAAGSAALALQPAAAVVHEDAGRSGGEREGENEGGKEREKEGESEEGGGYDRRGDGDGSVAGGSGEGGSGEGQEAEPIVLPRSTPRGARGGKRPRATGGRRGREDAASSMFNCMPHSQQGIEVAAVRALRNPFARGPPGSCAAGAASAAGARDGGGGDGDGTGNMTYSLGSPRSRPSKARPSPNLANRHHHRRLTKRRGSSEDVPRNSAALVFTGDSAVDSTVDSPSSGVVLFEHEPRGPAGRGYREQGEEEEGGGEGGGEGSGGIAVQPAARTGWGDNAEGHDDDDENKDKEDNDAAAASVVSAAPGGREVVGIPPGLADMWIQVCDQVAVDEALIKSAELGQVELTWWDDHPAEGGVGDAGSSSPSSSSSVDALQRRTQGSVLANVAAVEDVPDGDNDDEHDATNNDGSRRTSYLLVPDDPGAAAVGALSDDTALSPANGTAQGTDRSIARPPRRRRIVTSGASAHPRAFSLLFEGGDRSVYHWSPCRVLAVDHLRQRYLIRWGWDRGLTDDGDGSSGGGNTRGRGIVGDVGDASGVDGQDGGKSQDGGGQSEDSDGDDAAMLPLQKGPLPKGRKWVTRSNLRLRSETLETWEKQVALMSALQRRGAFEKGKRDILIDLSQRLDLRSPRPSSPVHAGVGSSKGKGAGTRGGHNGDGDVNGNGDNAAVVVGTLSVAPPPRDGRWGGNKASTIFLERERRAGPGLVEGPVSLPGEVHRRLHRQLFAACRSEHRHQRHHHHHHHHHHHQQKQKSSTGIRDREANGQGEGILTHALRSLQFLLRSNPGMTAGTTNMASLASLASFASLASLRSDAGSPALEVGDETAAADGVASNVVHAGVRNLDLALGTARGGQNRQYDDEHEEIQQTDEQRADQQHQRRQQAERIMDLWEALEQEVREDYEIMQLVCALKTKYDELDLLGDDAPESLLRLGPILRCLQLRGTASSSSSSSVSASPFRGGLVDVYDGRVCGDGQNGKGGCGGVVVPFDDARTRGRGASDGERRDSPTPSSVENEGPTTADNNNEEERSDCASEDEDARLGHERVDAGGGVP